MRSFTSLLSPERQFASVEIAPTSTPDSLGVAQGSTAYGSDNKTAMDLIGLTANESVEMHAPVRFMVYDQMWREDAAVKSASWLVTQPCRAAQWQLVPASEDPIDQLIPDALAWQFGLNDQTGLLDLSWREQLAQKLLMIRYGCMFEEIMVGENIEIYYDKDGDAHPIRPFQRLAPRFPQSIRFPDGIVTNTQTGLIETFQQWVPGARAIPGRKMAWYVMDREGSDWLGTSMLRPMYGPWKLKRAVMISAGIGWDRFAFGTPVIRYPKGGGMLRKREAEAIGRNWRTHERGYFVLEGPEQEGWGITIEGSGQMQDPTPLIHVYDEQIAAAAMQHFIVLGSAGHGNRALGDALSEPYYMFLNSIADDIATATMKHVFRKWVDMNFGPEYDVPKLNVSKIASRNVAVLAAAIAALADAGFQFADPETQNDIRDILDLRQLPTPVQEAVAAIEKAGENVGITPVAMPPQRQPLPGATDSSGRPLLSAAREGEGLGY
jgi:hypothetical protein